MKFWSRQPSKLPEYTRPFDWQDKLVIGASCVVSVVCLGLLTWCRTC